MTLMKDIEKLEGEVVWFSARKGFGFIKPIDEEKDIFVHWSGVDMNGYKQLKAGDIVEYNLKDSEKGIIAVDVKVIKSAEQTK